MLLSRAILVLALLAAALALPPVAGAAKGPPSTIRVGGPSAPTEAKVAIVGGARSLAGDRFTVRDGTGAIVLRGRLKRAPGKPDPWSHAFAADLSGVTTPGSYRVSVGKLRSRPWTITDEGSRSALGAILGYFAANRDGSEPSPIHGPVHLDDAIVHPDSPVHAGERFDLTGGWMDAGDMLHFTQTTAFAAAMLQASARLDPADAAALDAEADVGVRWLLKAHPAPDLFVAQVGDARDHELGFRDPADDTGSSLPGIGQRFAYHEVGGDLGGKAAAALALAFMRTGDPATFAAATEWYAAGLAAERPARQLRRAGYPSYASDFYSASNWKDSMASGAAELYRASCAAGLCAESYQQDFIRFASDPKQSGAYAAMGAVDDFASFGAAEVCGAFGGTSPFSAEAREVGCELLTENGRIAVRQGRSNAFGMPGYFSWGTTAQNGAAGALAALAVAGPNGLSGGCRTAAGARDYLLGRNPYGASFITGYGPRSPREPHHWAAVFGKGVPPGSVVGGPAPVSQFRSQGFPVRGSAARFGSRFATYEDRRPNYVSSEPAIDYAASSVLLLAAVEAHC